MILGFTGTRRGMTPSQVSRVAHLLLHGDVTEAHHGDCLGSDAQFHDICLAQNIPVVIHPPEDSKLRAFCKGAKFIHRRAPYITRNHDIVDACDQLIATPHEQDEPVSKRGGGTWATIRYARQFPAKQLIVIYPRR